MAPDHFSQGLTNFAPVVVRNPGQTALGTFFLLVSQCIFLRISCTNILLCINNQIFRKTGYIQPRHHLAREDLVKDAIFQLTLNNVFKIIYASIYTKSLDENINSAGIRNLTDLATSFFFCTF